MLKFENKDDKIKHQKELITFLWVCVCTLSAALIGVFILTYE